MDAEIRMEKDETFMREAIRLSQLAAQHGNEPFGAVLVKNDEIVFRNENKIHAQSDPSFHAELGLIRQFCHLTGITDLHEYTLYTSCEPCFMCSGAMVWAKLGTLVYAASNKELSALFGSEGSECSKMVFAASTHKPVVRAGVLREESMAVLRQWFPILKT